MKISNPAQTYINQTYANRTSQTANAQAPAKLEKASDEAISDMLKISPTTRDLQKISAAMDTEPTDRTKRVEDLKQQVQNNQYNVKAEQVAEKMIGSLMDGMG